MELSKERLDEIRQWCEMTNGGIARELLTHIAALEAALAQSGERCEELRGALEEVIDRAGGHL